MAHIIYIVNFGFKPTKPFIGLIGLHVLAGVSYYMLPKLPNQELKFILPIYMVLLIGMIWRATARLNMSNNRMPEIMGAIGNRKNLKNFKYRIYCN